MEKEIWKDIKGHKGLYQISNQGRVKSLSRTVMRKNGIALSVRERILQVVVGNHGYSEVNLSVEGAGKTKRVARLVALHFIPNPENKRTVNHKNGIKTDNRAKKLEWMTDSENNLHAFKKLGRKAGKPNFGKFGEAHHSSKAVLQLDLGGNLVAEHGSQHEAERETGINQTSISRVCLGQRRTAGGFIWKH